MSVSVDLEGRLLERTEQLSPAERRASEQLLQNYEDLPFLTADALAAKAETSASTVVRLVSKLGYGSYMDLQAEAQSRLKERLSSLERIRRVGKDARADGHADGDHSPSLEQDIRLLVQLAENISFEQVRAAARTIADASAVVIVGFRASAPLAYYLYLGLTQLIGPKIRLAAEPLLLPEHLSMIGPQDALLAISFPRYSTITLQAAAAAHKRGASVIAITNSVLSPLAASASVVLTCPFVGRAFQNSPIASYALVHVLIEQLIALLGPEQRAQMERQLSDAEDVLKAWGLWSESDGGTTR